MLILNNSSKGKVSKTQTKNVVFLLVPIFPFFVSRFSFVGSFCFVLFQLSNLGLLFLVKQKIMWWIKHRENRMVLFILGSLSLSTLCSYTRLLNQKQLKWTNTVSTYHTGVTRSWRHTMTAYSGSTRWNKCKTTIFSQKIIHKNTRVTKRKTTQITNNKTR